MCRGSTRDFGSFSPGSNPGAAARKSSRNFFPKGGLVSTPELFLDTNFIFNSSGCIIATREPYSRRCPAFVLVRSPAKYAWGVRADLPEKLRNELNLLAQEEPTVSDLRQAPVHANEYLALVSGRIDSGPAFIFPHTLASPSDVIFVEELRLLDRNFRGWTASEIPERLPIAAVLEDGSAVSVCFCARRSDLSAEAGLETSAGFCGRGFGPRVTAAWATAIRASGRIPLYSTSWTNYASLAVARKLDLVAYANTWVILD